METLKGSILSRSSHSGKETMYRLIGVWLDEYGIKNYTINNDYTIDVNADVIIILTNLVEFPEYIKFGVVRGMFNCSSNNLTSLKGAPRRVERGFYCSSNNLTSLEGAPDRVGGAFCCSLNKLTSLEGAPKEVGGTFICSYNKLTTLKGAPEKVGEGFNCNYNQLTSLKGAPSEVGEDFVCSNNKIQFTEEDVRRVCDVKGTIFK